MAQGNRNNRNSNDMYDFRGRRGGTTMKHRINTAIKRARGQGGGYKSILETLQSNRGSGHPKGRNKPRR